MKQVIVEISETGEVKVEAKCVVGSSCQDLTRDLQNAIGRTTADQKKPEFFQQHVQGQGQGAKQGA